MHLLNHNSGKYSLSAEILCGEMVICRNGHGPKCVWVVMTTDQVNHTPSHLLYSLHSVKRGIYVILVFFAVDCWSSLDRRIVPTLALYFE